MPIHHKDPNRNGTKYYDPVAIDEWYNDNIKKDETSAEADRRRKVADATLAEIKVQKARGDLVRITHVAAILTKQLDNVRSKLKTLPSTVAPHIYVPSLAERLKMLDDAITDVLVEISADTFTPRDWAELIDDIEKLYDSCK